RDAVDLAHPTAQRVAEHQEIEGGGHDRLGQRLAGHLEEPARLLGQQRAKAERVHGDRRVKLAASGRRVSCRNTSSSEGCTISTSATAGCNAPASAKSPPIGVPSTGQITVVPVGSSVAPRRRSGSGSGVSAAQGAARRKRTCLRPSSAPWPPACR